MKTLSLYIHLPFCIKKCAYCDFLSFPRFELLRDYMSALKQEISAFETKSEIMSVFIGGGTPSAVSADNIYDIMQLIARKFRLADNCEITIEANPGTLNNDKLKIYKNSGINRLSMGIQSLDNKMLSALGRIHDSGTALKSYELARKYFDNINTDLMFALPGQSLEIWLDTLKNIIALNPEHISAYSLIIEEGTPFYEKYEPVDEILDREMYYLARDMLEENGYRQYEISNFAKPDHECRHNLVYWKGGDYKGFGIGAASLWGNERLKNTENIGKYLSGVTVAERTVLDQTEQMQEFVMLGLRCTKGIESEDFYTRFGENIFERFGEIFKKHENTGLLEISGGNIRLTKKGVDLSNMVFVDFV